MLDSELFKLIIATIKSQLVVAGLPYDFAIKQAYQPRQQGVNTKPAAYVFKVGDMPFGSPLRKNVFNAVTNSHDHHEIQQYQTAFQISALATQFPELTNQLTSSDIVNKIRYIMQSEATIAALEAVGVGILRVTRVGNTPFIDDREQYEFNPSFDFTLTHKQDIVNKTPIVTIEEVQILNV